MIKSAHNNNNNSKKAYRRVELCLGACMLFQDTRNLIAHFFLQACHTLRRILVELPNG
jgi:hypothetical protein